MAREDLNKLTRWLYGFQYPCRRGRGKDRFRDVVGINAFIYLSQLKIGGVTKGFSTHGPFEMLY